MKLIAVIDYGMGNLRSVSKALERVGGTVEIISGAESIEKADALVLPGVGAFSQAMESLKSRKMIEPLCRAIDSGKLFLGICLGLQLLFAESEEGSCEGLNILPGKVRKFQIEDLKVPHMGWNAVQFKVGSSQSSLPEGIPRGSYFYFAHSYYVCPEEEKVVLATTEYGMKFASAVQRDNIFGVQFHPEKSGEKGLTLLKRFVRLSKK